MKFQTSKGLDVDDTVGPTAFDRENRAEGMSPASSACSTGR